MRRLKRALLILDRTAVLFVGLAAGAVVTMSFFPTAAPGGRAEASIPAPPVAAAALEARQSSSAIAANVSETPANQGRGWLLATSLSFVRLRS
jgi:hypothetical protein